MTMRFARAFHATARQLIAKGDTIPSIPLALGSPSHTVNLADKTASGRYLLVGVPGAFSPGCSQSHVPGYLNLQKAFQNRGIKNLFIVAVNDAFTTGAWANSLDVPEDGWCEILSDASGAFSKEIDTLFDASKFFGNERSKRFAAIIENGKVLEAFVEPDATSVDVSSAEPVLEELEKL